MKMMEAVISKITTRSIGILVENRDRTREFVVTATVLEDATESQNQEFMQDLRIAYEKYQKSVKRRRWDDENSI